jgi:hypothetical protein
MIVTRVGRRSVESATVRDSGLRRPLYSKLQMSGFKILHVFFSFRLFAKSNFHHSTSYIRYIMKLYPTI